MKSSAQLVHLDCTIRDGGYYNSWDFNATLVQDYLYAMSACNIDVVELGLRSYSNEGYKGPFAFTSEMLLSSYDIPSDLRVAVMINASELYKHKDIDKILCQLFPVSASISKVDIVRIASTVNHLDKVLKAIEWLSLRGFKVCLNFMQIANCSSAEVISFVNKLSSTKLDVLYFADSFGSMNAKNVANVVKMLTTYWTKPLGIHTHDNIGLAMSNSLEAIRQGVSWVDTTVTGMGRGAGNARTEEFVLEREHILGQEISLLPLMSLIEDVFTSMKQQYGWGTNVYYYLAGKKGIHPTYIQQMLNDSRFTTEDKFTAIQNLHSQGLSSYDANSLDLARNTYFSSSATGSWSPKQNFEGREVLMLATGPGVFNHKQAIEFFIEKTKPLVIAYNSQSSLNFSFIDYSIACHPIRLLADLKYHLNSHIPLIAPLSGLPVKLQKELSNKEVLDYGLCLTTSKFELGEFGCSSPYSLVLSYSLAMAFSGCCRHVYLAGFDGYPGDDPRNHETESIFESFSAISDLSRITSITPTRYNLRKVSVYGLI